MPRSNIFILTCLLEVYWEFEKPGSEILSEIGMITSYQSIDISSDVCYSNSLGPYSFGAPNQTPPDGEGHVRPTLPPKRCCNYCSIFFFFPFQTNSKGLSSVIAVDMRLFSFFPLEFKSDISDWYHILQISICTWKSIWDFKSLVEIQTALQKEVCSYHRWFNTIPLK